MGDPLAAALFHRPVKRRAQQRDLHKVVEMPGLQRSILTVVGEAEQFSGRLFQLAVPLQLADERQAQDGGIGGAAARAQFG